MESNDRNYMDDVESYAGTCTTNACFRSPWAHLLNMRDCLNKNFQGFTFFITICSEKTFLRFGN